MAYVAIMKVNGTDVEKFQEFETSLEADAHIVAHSNVYPLAYVTDMPDYPDWRWVCDIVNKTITDRGPHTQEELDAIEDADSNERIQRIEVKGLDRAQFAALLDHENRLRVLEGRQEITAEQLKTWVKERL